jgi:hypothetical protein
MGLAWQSWLEMADPHGFRRFNEQQYQRLGVRTMIPTQIWRQRTASTPV